MTLSETRSRRFPLGAELRPEGVHVRVWAPQQRDLSVHVEGGDSWPLKRDDAGYYSGLVPGLAPGGLYRLILDDGTAIADPASRFQPEGVTGPSQVVDPDAFSWTDANWTGPQRDRLVVYEMHIGTFTRAGTWAAATQELPELAAVGITALEVMPVAESPGRWGWGYDGVLLFAPWHRYGTPDDFRRFVNEAHRVGLSVVLDVVYNHLGPDGNYLARLASAYFSREHRTDWGEALNFDGPDNGPVREFFLSNARYWIEEFHLDGLRLDATQDIHDRAAPGQHILTEIGRVCREAAHHRSVVLIAENEPQRSELCRPADQGGYGLDALWNDDFHHTAMVALTGRREAYYTDYLGEPQEFVSAAKYGYLYQGQWYSWQQDRRGTPGFDRSSEQFITFLQNHDQIANSFAGLRAHQLGSPGRYRALTALLLLGPGTPMLFQGQEFAASTPFLYFADHNPDLAQRVAEGRRAFLAQFPSLNNPDSQRHLRDPADPETFESCQLDLSERLEHAAQYQLTKDLLALRHVESCFRTQGRRGLDGAVLADEAFLLRYFCQDGSDRLLIVNLGRELRLASLPHPLLGCRRDQAWQILLSTEAPDYGGSGIGPLETDSGWLIPAESALFLGLVSRPSPSPQGVKP